ncbi:hypothetical protein SAMN05428945_4255 [Streptomyces sp. 2224.1]|nr:hypothetical protein SAMN05428945_4255 [Streptomyces sp. 2224.1]
MKTWKTSRAPAYAAKKARVEHLYAIADGEVIPEEGEPEVVLCLDDFGPLSLQPHPAGSGPSAADGTRIPTASPGPDGGRLTPARTGSGICSRLTTWPGAAWAAGLVLGVRNLSQRGMFLIGGTLADRYGYQAPIMAGRLLRTVVSHHPFLLFAALARSGRLAARQPSVVITV